MGGWGVSVAFLAFCIEEMTEVALAPVAMPGNHRRGRKLNSMQS